jgi:SpoVK/Ycf46/Vps4 family AAA+-type ATPase
MREEFEFQSIADNDQITFADVAGLEDVKKDIMCKVLMPIKNPELASKYKIKAGGKILLYGPPGTGKTFIARAIAGEVDAKFYSINCQDLISKYMGDSSVKLDKLFETAQKNERAIIFFDEIDSIASKREGSTGVDGEMARFVATFLTKIDGFKKSKTNKMLLLLAATNRPWAIDDAMLRGGRFDTQIYVSPPDHDAILFMLKQEMSDLPIDSNVNLEVIAKRLEGFGGGDIVSICSKVKQKAYYRAIMNNCVEKIKLDDFAEVIKNQKNVITPESLEEFEEYKNK